MPDFVAKKLCPHLRLVKGQMARYVEMSGRVMAVLRNYDPNMATAGLDETYLKSVILLQLSFRPKRSLAHDAATASPLIVNGRRWIR